MQLIDRIEQLFVHLVRARLADISFPRALKRILSSALNLASDTTV